MLAAHGQHRLPPSLRVCVSAGEALPETVARQWLDQTRVGLTNHYGSTEAGFISVAESDDRQSAGLPVPGVRVRTTGPTWREEGELLIELPPGYQRQVGVAESGQGWLRSGDRACLDEAGRIRLLGRIGRTATVAGKQIDLFEVEDAIRSHPAVTDCRVALDLGDQPRLHAFVLATPRYRELELRRFLGQRLAPHKIPSRIRCLDDFPRTATGKVRMAEIERMAGVTDDR
jgi:acyl-coenzyme A synthetase/AMP-(fatty) acid ligase